MKRAFTFLGILVLSSLAALADGKKNHISLAASESLPITVVAATVDALINIGSASSNQEASFTPCGSYTLGYSRDLKNNRFRLGTDLAYAPLPYSIVDKESGETVSSDHFTGLMMLMFTGRFDYIKKEHFQFYGKAAAGAATSTKFNSVTYAFQVDPLAIRFGGPKIAGFFEAGLGFRGFLNLGIEFSF